MRSLALVPFRIPLPNRIEHLGAPQKRTATNTNTHTRKHDTRKADCEKDTLNGGRKQGWGVGDNSKRKTLRISDPIYS